MIGYNFSTEKKSKIKIALVFFRVFFNYFAAVIMQGKAVWPVIWIQKLLDGDKCKRMIMPSANRVFSK